MYQVNSKIDDNFKSLIYDFHDTLVNEAPHVNLDLFYNNIKSLEVKKINHKITRLFFINVNSSYNSVKNKIKYKSIESGPFHELFHLSTTKKQGDKINCGFHKVNLKTKSSLGRGLNEGYTSLLKQRYFGNNFSYQIEKRYASVVEKIIGKEKMEKLYFNADLDGLINELGLYDYNIELISFLIDLDNIDMLTSSNYDKFEVAVDSIRNCSDFLLKCFCKKTINDYNNGLLTESEVNNLLVDFIDSINYKYSVKFGTIKLIEEDNIQEVKNKYLSVDKEKVFSLKK